MTVQWTNKNEQTVYANRWFSVNLAEVELPDGRQ
ncbi:NUDIX hydrolase, partial [Streptomyces sp. NPDC007000]